jgi:alpha-L-fucosidase
VHASIASVPAFAPVGAEAGWYRRHLGANGAAHAAMPLVEVLAHHRDRWGFIDGYDDFVPLLTFQHLDAEHVAAVATAGRMGLVMMSARHHDGFCWWDAPGTEWTSTRHGPGRNVVDELSGACERGGLRFGTSYSPAGTADAATVAAQVVDLVERYRSELLWALDGPPPPGRDDVVRSAREVAARGDVELVVSDGWGSTDADVATVRREPPPGIVDTGWALSRPLGWSAILNRAERTEHRLSAAQLLALLTETVAKGGALLLEVGLDAEGALPRHHTDTIRAVGAWLAAHSGVVDGARPFTTWGDDDVRYTVPATGELVHAVDVRGAGRFAALHSDDQRVRSVRAADGATVAWVQDRDGLHVTRLDRTPTSLAAVYEVELEPRAAPVALFESSPPAPTPLAPLLRDRRAGDVVRLGDGAYAGPAVVPLGVSLCGAGAGRTVIVCAAASPLTLAGGAQVSDLTVLRSGPAPTAPAVDDVCDPELDAAAAVVSVEGDGASMTRVTTDAAVRVLGVGDVVIDGCTATSIHSRDASRLTVRDSTLVGDGRCVGIDIDGGDGHRIEGNDIGGHLGAVRISGAAGVAVRRNRLRARWRGVQLVGSDAATVTANVVDATMRAVDVAGGAAIEVAGNVVGDGDSGCIVEAGATDVAVADNRWERCRIGVLVWDAPGTHIGANRAEQLAGDAVVIGPELS